MVIHTVRHRNQLVFRHQNFFREGAVAGQAHDPLAGFEALNAVAHGQHFTGHFTAR